MTAVELAAIARDIFPPAGASLAIAMVDHQPGEKLASGQPSGIGGRTTYHAGFLVDGRFRVPAGPAFDRQRDAYRLIALLNGDPSLTPAPRAVHDSVPHVGSARRSRPAAGSSATARGAGDDLTPQG